MLEIHIHILDEFHNLYNLGTKFFEALRVTANQRQYLEKAIGPI